MNFPHPEIHRAGRPWRPASKASHVHVPALAADAIPPGTDGGHPSSFRIEGIGAASMPLNGGDTGSTT
ncbi:hypothetical protein GCM10009663_25130 [Kitasatospora arboriphila]|uniref:Uncharacterized protein n=1 Tax=Kitasatospora arboriphila TaxID=258052 RepID=A0ABP4E094_9ACTN